MTSQPSLARPGLARPGLADQDWLMRGPLPRLFDILDRDGEEARVVGGAVRNALLGLAVEEIDVATTATPEEVVRRAAAAQVRSVPTGIDHGTVTLILDGRPVEVTSLREDVETFGRKARVVFGRSWAHDAARRDFTINALSATRDGRVHDYVGGLADLAERRVRFIGDAAQRIAEDYLRILRFFRFHAAYGEGEPDGAALAACIGARAGLDTLSRERVRSELLKILAARRAVEAVVAMSEAGLLPRLLGGVPLTASLARFVAIETALGRAPDAVLRLAALAVLVTEDAERLGARLRLSNAEQARLLGVAEGWWHVSPDLPAPCARALLYRLQPERYADRVLIAWSRVAVARADGAAWSELLSLPQRWAAPAFPLAAADFLARGLARGPALGAALRAAEAAWIAADFPSAPAALAALADAAARDSSRT
jgi:tRNA nucleotidyltransferase/poly(A) polymerase